MEKDIPQEVSTEATHEELDKFLADGAERERESLDSSVLSKKMYSKGKRFRLSSYYGRNTQSSYIYNEKKYYLMW